MVVVARHIPVEFALIVVFAALMSVFTAIIDVQTR